MKKYNINVNGKMYQVEVEEVGSPAVSNAAPAPQSAPVAAPAAKPAPAAAAPAPSSSGPVAGAMSAPMPGTILDVKVSVGQSVKAGDILLILEAMKMENEIVAPNDGTVASVNVAVGSNVEVGEVLATLN